MNFYPFHIGDYASATRHLSWLEDMAYRRLLDAYYVKESPLPAEKRQAYRLVIASTDEQRAAVDAVLDEFFVLTDRGYEHERCEAEIATARSKREKAAQSAAKRWENSNPADAELPADSVGGMQTDNVAALPTQCERNANAQQEHANASSGTCEGNATNPNPIPNPSSKPMSTPDGVLVAGKPALPPCPHQEIVSLYHELLPMCPSVREWSAFRQRLLRSRWSENAKRQRIEWWRRFFGYVAESEFLTGRGSCASGRDPFVADLEWLIRPQNFVKVIEGKYHREAAA